MLRSLASRFIYYKILLGSHIIRVSKSPISRLNDCGSSLVFAYVLTILTLALYRSSRFGVCFSRRFRIEKSKGMGEAFYTPIFANRAMFFLVIGSSLFNAISALIPFAAERLTSSGSAKGIVHLVQITSSI
jgi:hypothetical protein